MPELLNTLGWAVSAQAEAAFSNGQTQGREWARLAEWDLVRYAVEDWPLRKRTVHIPTKSGVVLKMGFHTSEVCGNEKLGEIFQKAFQVDQDYSCDLVLDEIHSSFVLGWQNGVRTIYDQALEKV